MLSLCCIVAVLAGFPQKQLGRADGPVTAGFLEVINNMVFDFTSNARGSKLVITFAYRAPRAAASLVARSVAQDLPGADAAAGGGHADIDDIEMEEAEDDVDEVAPAVASAHRIVRAGFYLRDAFE